MDEAKFNRQVSLLCPTCGSDQFAYDENTDDGGALVECARCGRQLTREELVRENSENVNVHLDEIAKEFADEAAKEIRKSFQAAFSGKKTIRIKL